MLLGQNAAVTQSPGTTSIAQQTLGLHRLRGVGEGGGQFRVQVSGERERERERRAYDHRQRLATTRKNNIDTQLAYDSTHMSNMSTIYDAGPRSPCAPSTHLRVRVYADDSAADPRSPIKETLNLHNHPWISRTLVLTTQ